MGIPASSNMRALSILALSIASLASATPQFGGFGGHHGPVHHAPVHHAKPIHHAPVKDFPPRPFAYEFGVQDSYSGADFAKKEVQSPDGVVTGVYRVALPDGRIQIVTYTADHYNGYVADVRYEGAAAYPAGPPHHAAPHHAPLHHARPVHHAPVHHAPLHHGGPGPAGSLDKQEPSQ